MIRSAAVSTVAFLVFANPSFALENVRPSGRPEAALIGQPSIDPSGQHLVVEHETRGSAEPFVVPAWTPAVSNAFWTPGPYGAWDLDAPDRRSAMRFSVSGAFPEGAGARFDATPVRIQPRMAA
ncbi:MAG: hypothetical protein ABWZ40_13015 [Caulobacterales bacterium]